MILLFLFSYEAVYRFRSMEVSLVFISLILIEVETYFRGDILVRIFLKSVVFECLWHRHR